MTTTLGVLFDGLAYGMLLFLISVGLSVTMGLMRFINLAHGVFAMAGGYLVATLARRWDVNFFVALPLAFAFGAGLSLVLERVLYRPLYKRGPLDQVLLTVGILFVATAVAIWIFGSQQQPVTLPDVLQGRLDVFGVELSRYRLFLIAAGVVVTLALVFGLERTRFGARIRASVDRQAVAEAMGIRVERVFQATFAIGRRTCGARRRARHRRARARSELRAALSRVLPARRRRRRSGLDRRHADRGIAARRGRRRPASTTCRRSAPFIIYVAMIVLLCAVPARAVREADRAA